MKGKQGHFESPASLTALTEAGAVRDEGRIVAGPSAGARGSGRDSAAGAAGAAEAVVVRSMSHPRFGREIVGEDLTHGQVTPPAPTPGAVVSDSSDASTFALRPKAGASPMFTNFVRQYVSKLLTHSGRAVACPQDLRTGVQAILRLRLLDLNGRWQAYWRARPAP